MTSSYQIIISTCVLLVVNGFSMNFNRRERTCPDPAIENGQHDSMQQAWFRWTHPVFKTLNFICDEGYELQGPKDATCQIDGTWTELPQCIETSHGVRTKSICKLPPIGDNVAVYPKKPAYDLQETVYFVCERPPMSNKIAVTMCSIDGQFQPPLPKCTEPRCPPPELPRNGGLQTTRSSYAVGEIARFKCYDGYSLVGNATVTCGKDGYFPYTDTRCEKKESCARRCGETLSSPSFCSCDPYACLVERSVKCCDDFYICLNRFDWSRLNN